MSRTFWKALAWSSATPSDCKGLLAPCAPFSLPIPKYTPSLQTVSSCCQKLLSMWVYSVPMPNLVMTVLWVVHVLPLSERQHRLGMAVCQQTSDDSCFVTAMILNSVSCFTSTLQDRFACTAVCRVCAHERATARVALYI